MKIRYILSCCFLFISYNLISQLPSIQDDKLNNILKSKIYEYQIVSKSLKPKKSADKHLLNRYQNLFSSPDSVMTFDIYKPSSLEPFRISVQDFFDETTAEYFQKLNINFDSHVKYSDIIESKSNKSLLNAFQAPVFKKNGKVRKKYKYGVIVRLVQKLKGKKKRGENINRKDNIWIYWTFKKFKPKHFKIVGILAYEHDNLNLIHEYWIDNQINLRPEEQDIVDNKAEQLISNYLNSLNNLSTDSSLINKMIDSFLLNKEVLIDSDFYIKNNLSSIPCKDFLSAVASHPNLFYSFQSPKSVGESRKTELSDQYDVTVRAIVTPSINDSISYNVPLNFVVRFKSNLNGLEGFKIAEIIYKNKDVINTIPIIPEQKPIVIKPVIKKPNINYLFPSKAKELIDSLFFLINQQALDQDRKKQILDLFYNIPNSNPSIEVSS